MKKAIKLMAVAVFAFSTMSFTNTFAKDGKIKVNGVCEKCKVKIENAAKSVEGVKTAVWNAETKELTLNYDEKVTDINKISTAVANVGYNAGEVKANQEARKKLPPCCKGEGHGNHHAKATKKCDKDTKSCDKANATKSCDKDKKCEKK